MVVLLSCWAGTHALVTPARRIVPSGRRSSTSRLIDHSMVLDLQGSAGGANSAPTTQGECVGDRSVYDISYAQQYNELFASPPLKTSTPIPKPSNAAQRKEPGARQIPFSNVFGTLMRAPFSRSWGSTDYGRLIFFGLNHGVGLLAPLLFLNVGRPFLAAHFLLYCASGMGVTFSYHRQLAHRSFKTPKWLEYIACYCGMMAMQGGPIEWVSDHRYHHLHTETPLDPHSSYEGFYWSASAHSDPRRASARSNPHLTCVQAPHLRLLQAASTPRHWVTGPTLVGCLTPRSMRRAAPIGRTRAI